MVAKHVDPEIAQAQAKAKAAIKDIAEKAKPSPELIPHAGTGRRHAATTLRAHEIFGAPLPTGPTE